MKKIYILILSAIVLLGAYLAYEDNLSVTDPKEMINNGISEYKKKTPLTKDQEAYVKVQLAIANFMARKNTPPQSLSELVPTYFDVIPKDPKTNKPFNYKLVGKSYELGDGNNSEMVEKKPESVVEVKEDFLNPNKIVLEDFVYDPAGKRDPFKPFTEKQETVIDESAPPLQRYELSQLRVAAILTDSKGGRFAMVEDSTGRGYPVKGGDTIGINKGKVISVDLDKLDVLETITDAAGEVKQELRSIKLVSGGGEAKNLKNRPKQQQPKRKK